MIKAINDVVIIERDKYEGIIIAEQKMCHGTVLSVGPGRWKANVRDIQPGGKVEEKWYATSLKPNQRVCFSIEKGEEHEIKGKKVVVMREDDIAGILESAEVA